MLERKYILTARDRIVKARICIDTSKERSRFTTLEPLTRLFLLLLSRKGILHVCRLDKYGRRSI